MPDTNPSPKGLDLAALKAWLDAQRPGLLAGELTASLITGGKSNLTYRVNDGRQEFVVRRPPLGHVLATAHDMGREHRIISALAGTAVPVPPAVAMCDDPDVIGAPFYVMEFVAGEALGKASQLERRGPERTRAIAESLVDRLVDLHEVDFQAVGLSDFGRPDGYLTRQVARWTKQLEGSHSRELAGANELVAYLNTDIPQSPAPTIVHGDYRLDNTLVNDDDQITAMLDWEMSTLGDPLTDVALMTVYQDLALHRSGGAITDAPKAAGYPSVEAVLERYAERSGRNLDSMGFYRAFSFFKLAVIIEGIYYRFIQGQTLGEGFEQMGQLTEPVIQMGLASAQQA